MFLLQVVDNILYSGSADMKVQAHNLNVSLTRAYQLIECVHGDHVGGAYQLTECVHGGHVGGANQ